MTTSTPFRNARLASVVLIYTLVSSASWQVRADEPPASKMDMAQSPMPGMTPSHEAMPAASMTDMMGAPGLVPFDIMNGMAGQWMVGYQVEVERLDGNLAGTKNVNRAQGLQQYPSFPSHMTMQMQMTTVMWSPTDKLTLMAMLPYIKMSMGEYHRDGTHATESSEGIGDLTLRGTYTLYAAPDLRHRLLANFGVGLPTGSINQQDADGARMEYPMQTGSGTFSVLPGLTYIGQAVPWGWGADLGSTVRLGENDHGYRLGNRYQAGVSVARQLTPCVSLSTGAKGEVWENIHGEDATLDPTDEPTKATNRQGGKRLSALLGLAFHPAHGWFHGQQLRVQGEVPVAQSLDGPQLKRKWLVRCGWQVEF